MARLLFVTLMGLTSQGTSRISLVILPRLELFDNSQSSLSQSDCAFVTELHYGEILVYVPN